MTDTQIYPYQFSRFILIRKTDITGISGTGTIAQGVQFSDGQCSLWWFKHKTTGIYPNMATLKEIHCYQDNAYIRWEDEDGSLDGRFAPGRD